MKKILSLFIALLCAAARLLAQDKTTLGAFDEHLKAAQALFQQDKTAEAFAEIQAAGKADPTRYEAPALAAILLLKGGHAPEARAALSDAQKLAPAEKQPKLDSIGKLIDAAAPITPAAPVEASKSDPLDAHALRQMEMLRIAAGEANQANSLPERQAKMRAFLDQSASFLDNHPQALEVWTWRGAAAVELGDNTAGRETGRNIMALAGNSTDPKIIHVLALLESKGWIQEKPVFGHAFTISELGLEMRPIPKGTFTMGSPADEPGRDKDEMQHEVMISKPFWLGRTAVTHGQWKALMGTDLVAQDHLAHPNDNPPSKHGNTDDNEPMYYVNWDEAMAFCRKLNEHARADGVLPEGYEFTLPTEAQWEYACRAGTKDATYAGPIQILGKNNAPILDAIAWYGGNSSVAYQGVGWDTKDWPEKQYPGGNAGPRDVGLKQPNAWGLYDMLGDVNQWCRDRYGDYPTGIVTDPVGVPSGAVRVSRGGGWGDAAQVCRSACRGGSGPGGRNSGLGFRLALSSVP